MSFTVTGIIMDNLTCMLLVTVLALSFRRLRPKGLLHPHAPQVLMRMTCVSLKANRQPI